MISNLNDIFFQKLVFLKSSFSEFGVVMNAAFEHFMSYTLTLTEYIIILLLFYLFPRLLSINKQTFQ